MKTMQNQQNFVQLSYSVTIGDINKLCRYRHKKAQKLAIKITLATTNIKTCTSDDKFAENGENA